MTFFKAVRLLLLASITIPSLTWACEALLSSSPHLIPDHRLIHYQRDKDFEDMLQYSLMFPVPSRGDHYWTVIFDPRDSQKNQGYIVELQRVRGGRFVVESWRRASSEAQRNYFEFVARLHAMKGQRILLPKPRLKCESISVRAWVEAKLWLKHELRLHDVVQLLAKSDGSETYESGYYGIRHRIEVLNNRGQQVTIVVAENKNCPRILLTAFVSSVH